MTAFSRLSLAAAVAAGMAFGQDVLAPIGGWNTIIVYGKVQMEDGSAPPKAVIIERQCSDGQPPGNVGLSDKLGRFTWKMEVDSTSVLRCSIRGVLQGYSSSKEEIQNMNAFSDPHLPPIILSQKGSNSSLEVLSDEVKVPFAAQLAWSRAQKAIDTNRIQEADRQLNLAVKTAPNFAGGWNALGFVQEHENKPAEAWKDYRKAIELDPKLMGAYVPLARLSIEIKDWDAADKVTGDLIKRDAPGRYPEARVIQAMARFELKNVDGAIASANEAIRLDSKLHKFPSAEYILALSLDGKNDHNGASEHLKKYLAELPPRAPNADLIRELIDKLDKAIATGAPSPLIPPAPEAMAGTLEMPGTGVPGEAWVPGGRKALAAVAGLKDVPSFNDFFTEYSRALAREMTVGTSQGIPGYLTTLRAYMATVTDLLPLGVKDGDTTTITISLANDADRKNAEHVLNLIGWRLVAKDNAYTVEPGDQPADGPRQHVPKLFGIDEVNMQETLQGGKSFQFEIPSENARVVGGNDWSAILKQLPSIPGGIAAAFTMDVRVAKAYAGLGAMNPDASAAIIRSVGISNLVLKDAEVLARYGESFSVAKDAANVPGGKDAEPLWKKLAGADPSKAGPFFRALIEKNEGRLAAFYYAVWSADEAHQRFLLKNEARAERFYAWYRDSDEFKLGINRQIPGWNTSLLQHLPLNSEGNLSFPGGRHAWDSKAGANTPDEEVLLSLKNLEAFVPIARLEEHRAPLDEASVELLAQHYSEWKSLFPYFEKLPALGSAQFTALQAFTTAVATQPAARQNVVLGEWYSMVELIARGYKAGSIDGPASARAFQRTCEGLAGDNHAAAAVGTLRELAGGPNLSEAVADKLLRLSPERRSQFQRVLELQSVPAIDSAGAAPDPSKAVTALSGFVYAASVDPDALLVSEDPQLLSRHRFVAAESASDKKPFAFAPAALVGSNSPPGSFVRGGFVNFEEVAHGLASGGRSVPPIVLKVDGKVASPDGTPQLSASAAIEPAEVIFHVNGRLVEAYATVTDSRGRYVDDLAQDRFTILDGKAAQDMVAFESHATPVSVALLLDTTGSMTLALPALKAAALKLIGDLRPVDSVAVYSFNRSVTQLQPFTTDMDQAKRAVLSTEALGETALYDALARVARDLSGRPGKKVIVVFTDGDDNSSTLTTDTAMLRVKATGVPVYTIAQGEALSSQLYLKQLADLSKATGGESFAIKDSSEIGGVFEKVSEDLSHGYLLVFAPPAASDHVWHPITIQVRGSRGDKVRAREGYYPE